MISNKTKVIVTVDDFGPRSEVNERAFKLFEKGLITRVSAIVNMPWPVNTVEKLKVKNIPVGLHLNISSGNALSPIGQVHSLVNSDGSFLPENKGSNLSHIMAAEISSEFNTQLQHFHSIGLVLSHLDNHRPDIYFFPHLLDCALNLARSENVPFRHPLRNVSSDDIRMLAQIYRCSENEIERLMIYYDDALTQKGVRCPDYFLSDTSFGSFENALGAISRKSIKGSCEIAVHLEGELGKSNFEFMSSDNFLAWASHFEFVQPSDLRLESRKA